MLSIICPANLVLFFGHWFLKPAVHCHTDDAVQLNRVNFSTLVPTEKKNKAAECRMLQFPRCNGKSFVSEFSITTICRKRLKNNINDIKLPRLCIIHSYFITLKKKKDENTSDKNCSGVVPTHRSCFVIPTTSEQLFEVTHAFYFHPARIDFSLRGHPFPTHAAPKSLTATYQTNTWTSYVSTPTCTAMGRNSNMPVRLYAKSKGAIGININVFNSIT